MRAAGTGTSWGRLGGLGIYPHSGDRWPIRTERSGQAYCTVGARTTPGQPVLMFFTYGWLHAGPGHLIGNLGALLWLAPPMLNRFGTRGFISLWAACLLGGALGFALLTSSPAPMVGASEAPLFGLAGAWLVYEMRSVRSRRERLWRGVLGLVALLAINAVAWALQGATGLGNTSGWSLGRPYLCSSVARSKRRENPPAQKA